MLIFIRKSWEWITVRLDRAEERCSSISFLVGCVLLAAWTSAVVWLEQGHLNLGDMLATPVAFAVFGPLVIGQLMPAKLARCFWYAIATLLYCMFIIVGKT
jgi:hypothetical protein